MTDQQYMFRIVLMTEELCRLDPQDPDQLPAWQYTAKAIQTLNRDWKSGRLYRHWHYVVKLFFLFCFLALVIFFIWC